MKISAARAHGAKFEKNDTEKLTEYLKNVDVRKFVEKTTMALYTPGRRLKDIHLVWAPVIESKRILYQIFIIYHLFHICFVGDDALDAFITETPEEILRKGVPIDVDAFIGYNSAVIKIILGGLEQ